jgi:hypothetical protein
MKVTTKFWKNSNTNHLLKSVEITETKIQGLPIRWYNVDGSSAGENLVIKGYVEIKEKKFK